MHHPYFVSILPSFQPQHGWPKLRLRCFQQGLLQLRHRRPRTGRSVLRAAQTTVARAKRCCAIGPGEVHELSGCSRIARNKVRYERGDHGIANRTERSDATTVGAPGCTTKVAEFKSPKNPGTEPKGETVFPLSEVRRFFSPLAFLPGEGPDSQERITSPTDSPAGLEPIDMGDTPSQRCFDRIFTRSTCFLKKPQSLDLSGERVSRHPTPGNSSGTYIIHLLHIHPVTFQQSC